MKVKRSQDWKTQRIAVCTRESTENTGALPTGVLCGTRSNSCTILMSNSSKDSKSYRKKHHTVSMSKLWNWIISVLGSTDPTDAQITLCSSTRPRRAVFPQHIFTSLSMVHKSGQQETKPRTLLLGARERLNADSFLRILICLAHTFHIMTVPDTSLRKQLCYLKCNTLFLKRVAIFTAQKLYSYRCLHTETSNPRWFAFYLPEF